MSDNFSSEESDNEPDFYDDLVQQKAYLKILQQKCNRYDKDIKTLNNEKMERDSYLQQTQREIEDLQMQILYNDLKINKLESVQKELEEKDMDRKDFKAGEQKDVIERLDKSLPRILTKYINRVMFSKKVELEDKLVDKKKNIYQAVCVKFVHNSFCPRINVKNSIKMTPRMKILDTLFLNLTLCKFSGYLFSSLSKNLTFRDLFNLCKEHWVSSIKIQNENDFVLTDQEHHDMALLYDVPIVQYLIHEGGGLSLFVLRPKNIKMKELMTSQKTGPYPNTGVMLVQETEQQGKIREEFRRVFALLRRAKPGIKTYANYKGNSKGDTNIVDSTILNFLVLVSIMVLMLLALTWAAIQPEDARELNAFNSYFIAPSFYSNPDEFYPNISHIIYDRNENYRPLHNHYLPIGKKRVVMNKMKDKKCLDQYCIYDDCFTSTNIGFHYKQCRILMIFLDSSPLNDTLEQVKIYRTVPDDEQLDIQGRGISFDGSGFIYDFDVGLTLGEADKIVSDLKLKTPGTFFGVDSRSFIFDLLYIEPNRHIIFERTLLFEFTSSNLIEIVDRKTYFKPHLDSDPNDVTQYNISLALLILTLVGYVINIFLNQIKGSESGKTQGTYYVSIRQQPDQSIQEIINTNKFMTFHKYGQNRQNAIAFLTLALFFHSLNMIRSLVFSATINVFLNIFVKSYKDFLAFLVIFFSCFLAFGFVFWTAFGPYMQDFDNLASTTFEVFQYFATGNTMIVSAVFGVNGDWGNILIVLICFIIFIQLDALMMSIIQENVRCLFLKTKPTASQKLPFREALDRFILRMRRSQKRFVDKFRRKNIST